MVRDMVVSRLFGAGLATDAFFAAFQIPNMLRRFFAEGALTSAFVPTFSEYYTQRDEREARDLANTCFTLLTVIMAVLTILGIIFSPAIVGVMFPGFRELPGKFDLTVLLNRLMFPYLFFISLVALCMGILNTVRHFFTPAISTVFLNIAMILAPFFFMTGFRSPSSPWQLGFWSGDFCNSCCNSRHSIAWGSVSGPALIFVIRLYGGSLSSWGRRSSAWECTTST